MPHQHSLLALSALLVRQLDELTEEIIHHTRPLEEIRSASARIQRQWQRFSGAVTRRSRAFSKAITDGDRNRLAISESNRRRREPKRMAQLQRSRRAGLLSKISTAFVDKARGAIDNQFILGSATKRRRSCIRRKRGFRDARAGTPRGILMSAPDPADTVKSATPAGSPGTTAPSPLSSLVRIDVWGESHAGRVRQNNEDHFSIVRFGRFLETVRTNVPSGIVPRIAEEVGYGMLLADGVGGHSGGEIASQLAITTFVNLVLTTSDWILRLSDDMLVDEVIRRARERAELINRALTERAEADPSLRKLGTTMTVAWSLGKDLFVAHIGDSRAYVLRRHLLHQITRDHTLAQELIDSGAPRPKQVPIDRIRHILTRALGAGKDDKIDVTKINLEDGDCLLLCSDGLTDMVSREVIETTLQIGNAGTACRRLVDLALEAGGKDNVTVIVARYSIPKSL